MQRRKKPKPKKRTPPYKRIPPEHGRLTAIANQLYDLVFSLGLGGCWMSNKTIADNIPCSKRQVQRARQLLVKRQVIITARTNPRTWMMWSMFHPAVKNCKILLYPVKQKMLNPAYEIPACRVGVTFSQNRGDKMSPKLDVVATTYATTVEPAVNHTAGLSTVRTADTTPPAVFTSGVAPLKPAAVQGEPWSKVDFKTLISQRERVRHLVDYGFTFHEAGDRVIAECDLKFNDREKFWIDELMDLEVNYDDAFDLVLLERSWNKQQSAD